MMARVTSMLGFVRRSNCPNSNCNAPKMQEINLSSDMRDLENPDTLGIRLNYGIHEECVGTLGGDSGQLENHVEPKYTHDTSFLPTHHTRLSATQCLGAGNPRKIHSFHSTIYWGRDINYSAIH